MEGTPQMHPSAAGSGSDAIDMSQVLPTITRQALAPRNQLPISPHPSSPPDWSSRSPMQNISANTTLELLLLNASSFKETLLLIDPDEQRHLDHATPVSTPWLSLEPQSDPTNHGVLVPPEVSLSPELASDLNSPDQKDHNELLFATLAPQLTEIRPSVADSFQLPSSTVSSKINPSRAGTTTLNPTKPDPQTPSRLTFQRNRPNLSLSSQRSSLEEEPSETSSPFVLQPDISVALSAEEATEIKLQTYQSLVTTPKKHLKSVEPSSAGGLFNSSANNTINQLDESDIISISKPSNRSHQSGSTSRSSETPSSTPWRNFRSRKRDIPFSKDHNTVASFAEEATVHSGSKVDDLKKQIVGFKVEIRLMKNFLQRIILHSLLDLDYSAIWSEESKKSDELEKLKAEFDEVYKLNEDLYRNLEMFQNDIHNKENIINQNQDFVRKWGTEIDQILQLWLQLATSQQQADDIRMMLQIPVNSAVQINDKLEFLLQQIAKTASKTYPLPPTTSSEAPSRVPKDFTTKVLAIDTELAAYIDKYSLVEAKLRREVKNSHQLRFNYQEIVTKFNRLIESAEMKRIQLNMDTSVDNNLAQNDDNVDNVRTENERLIEMNRSVDAKLEEYQKVIDRLQGEVNALKAELEGSTSGHNLAILQNPSSSKSRSTSFKDPSEQYDRLQRESSRTIASLTSQLQSKKQEAIALRNDKLKFDKLSYDLEVAIGKQRILAAEKIKLTYTIESLTDDKVALQANIANLTEKVTNLTVAKNENENKDSVQRKYNILEYQFNDLLSTDVDIFAKLLQSFEKIADDVSLQEPKRKIDWLTKMIENGRPDPLDISEGESKRLLKYHKSVLEYFSRAVGIIVHDHVKILLKKGETERQKSEYISKLQQRIDELTRLNDSISEEEAPIGNVSPKMNLRLEELTNRWKAEREARVYDNKALQKRLAELESENATLRKELIRSKGER